MNSCQVLMSLPEIEGYNRRNAQLPLTKIVQLEAVNPTMAGFELMAQLVQFPLPSEPRFDEQGHYITEDFYKNLQQQMNLKGLQGKCTAQFGVMTDNAHLRIFPTDAQSFRKRWDDELDRFSASLLKFAEPILIWHSDSMSEWLFIQNRHAWGWVRATAVAIIPEHKQWLDYVEERCFVQVIASRLVLGFDDLAGQQQVQLLLMGTKLPLYGSKEKNYVVYLPQRGNKGQLVMLPTTVPQSTQFAEGFLPFNQAGLIEQGLKMLSEPYGWGGKNFYRDCTSLVDDIFGTFGFMLARNSNQQQQMAGVHPIAAGLNKQAQKALLDLLPVGTVLYLPGHAMIYLGVRDGSYRLLHSVYQMGVPIWSEILVHRVKRVMLGHLEQHRADGQTFLASLTGYWVWGQH